MDDPRTAKKKADKPPDRKPVKSSPGASKSGRVGSSTKTIAVDIAEGERDDAPLALPVIPNRAYRKTLWPWDGEMKGI